MEAKEYLKNTKPFQPVHERDATISFVFTPSSFDEIPQNDIIYPNHFYCFFDKEDEKDTEKYLMHQCPEGTGITFTHKQHEQGTDYHRISFLPNGTVFGNGVFSLIKDYGHIGGPQLISGLSDLLDDIDLNFWSPNGHSPKILIQLQLTDVDPKFDTTVGTMAGSKFMKEPMVIILNREQKHPAQKIATIKRILSSFINEIFLSP